MFLPTFSFPPRLQRDLAQAQDSHRQQTEFLRQRLAGRAFLTVDLKPPPK